MSVLRVSLSLILLASIATVAVTQPPEKMPTADEITKSWGTLSDKYTSLKMTWKQKMHHTGYVGEDILAAMKITHEMEKNAGRNPKPIVIHGKEHRYENQCSFIWSKHSWRLEKSGASSYISKPNPVPDHWSLVFDGMEITCLKSPGLLPHHQAIINRIRFQSNFDQMLCRPMSNHLLGANSEIAGQFNLYEYQISPRQPVMGMKAVQAKKINPMTKSESIYVFIPTLDFAVAEHTTERKGKLLLRYRAEFDPKSKVPFIPKSWTYEVHMDGKFCWSHVNTLESLSVDAPVSDDTFKVSFPPGTTVIDQRTDQEPVRYTVPEAKPPEKK